jgi:hypothetical protein
MLTEFVLRGATSGFYGALVQSFRFAEPRWAASLTVVLMLPFLTHSMELLVHWLKGTPELFASVLASVCFTALSTAFHLFAMRRGVLIVGRESKSLLADLRETPRLIWMFIRSGFAAVIR